MVATYEPSAISKSRFDTIVVEDSQGYRRFPNSPRAYESHWGEVYCETNNLLDQFVASKTSPRRRWRGFARYARYKYEILDPPASGPRSLTWFESEWVSVDAVRSRVQAALTGRLLLPAPS